MPPPAWARVSRLRPKSLLSVRVENDTTSVRVLIRVDPAGMSEWWNEETVAAWGRHNAVLTDQQSIVRDVGVADSMGIHIVEIGAVKLPLSNTGL